MRKVTGKKKDATNGEDDGSEIQDQESVGENGEPEDPLSGTDEQNGDADAKDGADSETADEDDLPLKEAVKKTKKGGKSKKKSGKKGKKEKKRVTIDAPEDDGTGDDSAGEADEEYEVSMCVWICGASWLLVCIQNQNQYKTYEKLCFAHYLTGDRSNPSLD